LTDVLSISIALGLVVSLIFSEFFGILGTGLIVPGYLALHYKSPKDLIITYMVALLAYGLVQLLSQFLILFGKRKSVLILLFAYLIGTIVNYNMIHTMDLEEFTDVRVIGYIIPGLIAIWFERQGVLETISVLTIASVIVRLLLMLVVGVDLP